MVWMKHPRALAVKEERVLVRGQIFYLGEINFFEPNNESSIQGTHSAKNYTLSRYPFSPSAREKREEKTVMASDNNYGRPFVHSLKCQSKHSNAFLTVAICDFSAMESAA